MSSHSLNRLMSSLTITLFSSLTAFAAVKAKTVNSKDDVQTFDNDNDKKLVSNTKIFNDNEPKVSISSVIESCASRVSQWRQITSVPGTVIGVSIKGKNVWIHGDGFANIETNVRCHRDTVMRIASISKSITAILLAKLIEEKKLDYDTPIDTYLSHDKFPVKNWEGKKVDITLRQLASHTAGIRHYKKDESKDNDKKNNQQQTDAKKSEKTQNPQQNETVINFNEFQSREYYLKQYFPSVTESLKIFKDDPLEAKPATKYVYTTFGYTLISAVIETALNGETFPNHLIKFLHNKLGMTSTVLDQYEPIVYNRSSYYIKLGPNGKLLNAPYVDNSYKWAGGGLLSSIPDLLRFGNIMLYSYRGESSDGKKGFLKKETVQQMWTPVENTDSVHDGQWGGYGIGWRVIKNADSHYAYCAEPPYPNMFSHSGGAIGASSMLVIEPDNEIIVAIICNLQSAAGISKLAIDVCKEFSKLIEKSEKS